MMEFKRKATIQNLIEAIFGFKCVSYIDGRYDPETDSEVTIGSSGTFDNFGYTYRYRNKFDILFDITFNTSKCKFSHSSTTDTNHFTRDNAIANAIKYFKGFDICVPEYFENEYDKQLFSKLIYKLISTELLPAIFNTDENRMNLSKKELANEDITPDFVIAMNNVKAVLESKDIESIIYRNAKMSDIETLNEDKNSNNKSEDRYVMCLHTEDIVDFVIHKWDLAPYIEVFFQKSLPQCENKGYNAFIEDLKQKSIFLQKEKDVAFDFSYDFSIKPTSPDSMTIALLGNHNSFNFLPRYFYYTLNLNEHGVDTLKRDIGQCLSLPRVLDTVKKNASKALESKYRKQIKEYYKSILETTVSYIDKLTSVNYNCLMSIEDCGVDAITKALGEIHLDVNKLYDLLSDRKNDESHIKALILWLIKYSTYLLCDALLGIIAPPRIGNAEEAHNQTSEIIDDLKDYYSQNDISEFVKSIENQYVILNQIEEMYNKFDTKLKAKIDEIDHYVSIGVKTDFTETNKKLREVECDKEVFKRLCNCLYQLTSKLQEKK